MKLKIVVLVLIPLLIMAVDINEGKTIWTHDGGFFQIYRPIKIRALEVDGDVVVWGKECEFPSRVLVFDPNNYSLVAHFNDFDATLFEYIRGTNIFYKSNLGSDWNTGSVSGRTVNNFSYHSVITGGYLVAATNAGVYQSSDGGSSWSGVKLAGLKTNILDAVLGPVNQSAAGMFSNKYFAATNECVYHKTRGTSPFDSWEPLPSILEDQDFEDVDTTLSGYLDSLPEGWTQTGIEDKNNYVRLDTLNTYSGDYSLLVYSSAVGGANVAARYELPDMDYLVCGFQFMPGYHSGIIEIKNKGLGAKIAFRYGQMCYYTPGDVWVVIEESGINAGMFNELKVVLYFDDESYILCTPTSIDTLALYEAEDNISEVVFSSESFGYSSLPYWIDDFYAHPEVYSLAPHPDSIDYVYAGTPLGIYSFDGNEWALSLDVEDEWIKLRTDLMGNYIVAASHDLTYITDDQGVSWDNITGAIPSINDIYVDVNGIVYAATDSFPYKYDGTWTLINNGFLENGIIEQVKNCRAITMIGTDTIVVGNYNGVYVSVNGGDDWFENNEGIEPYPITSSIVDEVNAYFEDAVPSDTTTGLLELLTDRIGPIPDVDGDNLLHIILLDVYEDGDENDPTYDIAVPTSAYFDPRNEEPTTELYSNEMDMIYVDVALWSGSLVETKREIARSLTQMIEWNYDEDEDGWIVRGYGEYGAYLAEVGADNIDFGIVYEDNANILLLRDDPPDRNRGLEYLFIQYLRDEYGDGILDDLNLAEGSYLDPQSGIITVRKLQSIEAVDSTLVGLTPGRFVDAFKDWVISCYMDSLDHVKDINFRINKIYVPPVYVTGLRELSQSFYSGMAWRIDSLRNPLVFSGNDNNDYHLHVVEYGPTTEIHEIADSDFDEPERNIHRIDMDNPFVLLVEVVSSRGIDPANAFYNLSLNQTVDNIDIISILQSPLADRFLRIYYYTGTKRLIDAGVEGGYITFNEETSELSLMTGSSAEGYRIYYGDIVLPVVEGTVPIYFESEDISGNQYINTFNITIKSIGIKGGYIATSDNSFKVDIPENALEKTYHVTACNTGNSFYVGPNKSLNENAVITIDVSSMESNELSIYRKDGDNWIEIPCARRKDELKAEINRLGEFKVMTGNLVVDVPETLELSTNTLSPFDISFAIPVKANVRIDVYNALGQRVRTLVSGMKEPGFYTVRWNSRTDNGDLVGNGVYFYRLSASGESLTKKIIVVR